MRKIREVLRLRDEHGASQRRILAACRLSRTTLRDYLRRVKAAGLTYAAATNWSEASRTGQSEISGIARQIGDGVVNLRGDR